MKTLFHPLDNSDIISSLKYYKCLSYNLFDVLICLFEAHDLGAVNKVQHCYKMESNG